jgi:hypothetical protein
LREKLLGQQLSVWQDIVSLEGGRDWWSQIEEALKSKALEHFVLLVYAGGARDRRIAIRRRVGKILNLKEEGHGTRDHPRRTVRHQF